jgi:hypothetical protein
LFGARPSAPDGTVSSVAAATGISEGDLKQLWSYADDLMRNCKCALDTDPAHNLLHNASWNALSASVSGSLFTVEAIPAPTNRRGIMVKDSKIICATCWVIDERKASRIDDLGIVCVCDPLAVVFALRSSAESLERLALEFASEGIPFWMPKPLDQVEPANDTTEYVQQQNTVGQQRPADYHFSTDDYLAYLRILRSTIHEDVRVARLALMVGAFPWRLALTLRDVEDVLNGPSGYSASAARNMSLRFQYRQRTLVEDRLLDSEMSLLRGEARVPTGGSTAFVSFYPPEKDWWTSPHGHVGWSPAQEEWLLALDAGYRAVSTGDTRMLLRTQPKSSRRWAKDIGHQYNADKILLQMRVQALRFLENHVVVQ